MKTDTITVERLPNERGERYQARVEYITAGPDRSLRDLAQKLNKSLTLVGRWSSEDDWATHARRYDETVYTLAAQDAADTYRANLEAHRDKAMKAGQSLYAVAGQLLNQLNTALGQPRKIRGEDGKMYTLHGIELNSTTLTTVSKALQIALDLEAHSLQIDRLLPMLAPDGADDSE